MKSVDIAVIGLGVYGSAAARAFAANGWRVLAVEQAPADEVPGASHGPVRMVRTDDPDGRGTASLAIESAAQWRALSEAGPEPLFRGVPGIFAGPKDGSPTHTDQHLRITENDPLLAGAVVPAGWTVTRNNGCGLLEARAAVLALRKQARELGAELAFGRAAEPAEAPPTADAPMPIRVGGETVMAGQLLFCTGAWTLGLPEWARIPGLRAESAHMQTATFVGHSEIFGKEAFYVFGDGDDRFCAMPLPSGKGLQFGHFSLPGDVVPQPEMIRRRDMAALRRFVPGLGETQERTTVRASYTMPPDGSFVLRRVSARAATLVACSGVGFKFAPAITDRVVALFQGSGDPVAGLRVECW
ncbi:FAD-dependent oxidoreductase [Streptomyces sp. NBC_00683]|uniref:FAD-dependent oxidoreductase n=1 Tax=Streptomyces sp. NBC_00683 TaxID=2903670 RepID=UPI002E32593E|nr:FAD-dependent oxidoreductase [Streptomyces sp. NBC_00683]